MDKAFNTLSTLDQKPIYAKTFPNWDDIKTTISREDVFQIIQNYNSEVWIFLNNNNRTYQDWVWSKWPSKIHTAFRTLSKSKSQIARDLLIRGIVDFYSWKWFNREKPLNIVDSSIDTFFVVSWIQKKSIWFTEWSLIDEAFWFNLQPCIRTQFTDKVDWIDWIATSFTNVSTYHYNKTIANHLAMIDDFFKYISSIWLYLWDVTIKNKTVLTAWNWTPILLLNLYFYYGDIQIGDSFYATNLNEADSHRPLSEVWFWLERIALSRNKHKNMFEFYGENLVDKFSDKEIDAVKTVTLMILWWLDVSNSWAWYRLKLFLKALNKDKNYFLLIKSMFEYRKIISNTNHKFNEILEQFYLLLSIYGHNSK